MAEIWQLYLTVSRVTKKDPESVGRFLGFILAIFNDVIFNTNPCEQDFKQVLEKEFWLFHLKDHGK